MLQPEHTGSTAAGFPTNNPQLEQSQALPGSGPLESICSSVGISSSLRSAPHLCHAVFAGRTRHAPAAFSRGVVGERGDPTPLPCERVFVGEGERAAAEAEVARRSRVMAGLDEADGALLEASIVEAMQRLRAADPAQGEAVQADRDGP